MPRLLLVLLAIAPLNAQLLVDIYAGGVIRTGVPANGVPVGNPTGVTWDPSGNIVFTDSTYNVIRRVAPNGIITTIAGTGVTGFAGDGGPATSALLYSPSNPQYDAAGNLYFFDSLNVRIRRIDTHGIITTIAGDGEFFVGGLDIVGPATSRSLPDPLSFAVDQSGTLYIVEPASNNILRLTPAGDLEMFAQVAVPTGVAVDGAGNVYVSSAASPFASIQRVSPNGTVTTFAIFTSGPDLYSLALGSTDAAGNLYVLFNNQLFRYAPDGTNTALPIPAGSYYPLSSDPQGDLAFASSIVPDAYVQIPVIQEFSAQSVLTTVAGGAPQPAPDGTPLSQAWFLDPRSIAFSHAGDMYIAEFGACLIRKISAAGVLSTFAGTGKCGYPSPSGTAKTADLVYPGSIAIDSQDNVWVADDFLNLYSISQQGVLSAMIKTPVAGGTGQLAIDAQNRIYVLGGESLYRVLSDGTSENLGTFQTYEGIGADSSGNVYFSENGPSNTYVVNNDGSVTLKYPGFTAYSLTFDPSGNIWGNNGELTTDNASGIANIGVYGSFGSDNGPAQSADLLGGPIAFGPDGSLYFAGDPILRVTGSGPATPPVISQGGIVNAISYAGGSLAPGEIVSIFGSNFGVSSLVVNAVPNNTIPPAIGRTKVVFGGWSGAITAITPNQINVFVPYELIPGATVNVQVQVDNILSAPVSMPVVQTAPGLSPSILNQDGTVNTSSNPAPRGSIVSFYGTGLGLTTPQLNDGNIAISTPYSTPLNPPAISIGGQQAVIQYAGDAPTLPTGIFQINAAIPTTINPGPAPVLLASSQVTIYVK